MTVRENLLIGAEASRNSTFVLVFLAALKVIVGFYSGSAALIADGVHTSLDIFTSLAVWVGLKLSLKHSGEKFPYGYYKSENLVALFVSILILLSGLQSYIKNKSIMDISITYVTEIRYNDFIISSNFLSTSDRLRNICNWYTNIFNNRYQSITRL